MEGFMTTSNRFDHPLHIRGISWLLSLMIHSMEEFSWNYKTIIKQMSTRHCLCKYYNTSKNIYICYLCYHKLCAKLNWWKPGCPVPFWFVPFPNEREDGLSKLFPIKAFSTCYTITNSWGLRTRVNPRTTMILKDLHTILANAIRKQMTKNMHKIN